MKRLAYISVFLRTVYLFVYKTLLIVNRIVCNFRMINYENIAFTKPVLYCSSLR